MKRIICLMLTVVLVLTGCSANKADSSSEAAKASEPQKVAACTGSLAEIWQEESCHT